MIEDSVAVRELGGHGPGNPERVECFRHEGVGCPRCDGSGYRDRRYCAGCGEPSGKPSAGGKALGGLRNRRGKGQLMYCMNCHPELVGVMCVMGGTGRPAAPAAPAAPALAELTGLGAA